MELFADRFTLIDTDVARRDSPNIIGRCGPTVQPAIDVSCGERTVLVHTAAGGPSDQLQWSLRCGRFASLHHRHIATLVDFGLIGDGRRFEAWRGADLWRGDSGDAARVRRHVATFLGANDLTPCGADALVVDAGGRPVVVPDASAGRDLSLPATSATTDLQSAACGIESIERPVVAAVAELLSDPTRTEPTAVAIWGDRGSGRHVVVSALARVARTTGFVPVDATLDDPAMWEAIGDRSLLLIDRQFEGGTRAACGVRDIGRAGPHRTAGRGWHKLLDLVTRRGRAHLLLMVTSEPVPRVPNLRLEPVSIQALTDAVRPFAWVASHRIDVEAAARRACGRPGRFAAALWHTPGRAGGSSMAAERAPHYEASRPGVGVRTSKRAWPVAGDVAALRRKLQTASACLAAGRRETAIRELRSVVSALARRHDWGTAVHGAATLAEALLARGQAAESRRVLDDAGEWATQGADEAAMGALALVRAAWHVHHGALGEAEAVARGALSAAEARDDTAQHVAAVVALARALFWQARFAEAGDVVARVDAGRAAPGEAVALAIAAAYAAVGWTAAGGGAALAAQALAAAERLGDARWLARAHGVAALAHLVGGDVATTRRSAEAAVASARVAHDAQAALHARLLAAEADRRDGRLAPATRLLARLGRLPRGTLSATAAARVALLRDLVDDVPPTAAAERLANTTGVRALSLFAPRRAAAAFTEPRLEDVLDLVARMQAAEDDRAALVAVCAGVRHHLRAAAVGFVVAQGASYRLEVSDGARLDPGVAARALAAGQLVTAHPDAGGAEAATPVPFGGRTIGALAARWTAGVVPQSDRMAALLALGSALGGPALLAASRAHVPGLADEISGVSEEMHAVRSAIERAAPVSYPVLVEGESGSGKELVARALHRRSPRRDRAFVAVNCAAIPDDLVEAELFGYAKGAFTGATMERPGVFEEAHGGTLFLDEVGELSPRAQAKLLRTLQEGEVRRVGENLSRRVDVRVVAATNRQLRSEVTANRFRLDLLYRLDVVRIVVPPLRQRTSDLPCLIERFWHEATERVQSRAVLSAATLAALAQYHWPGNVRELQNVMAALAVRAPKRGVVPPSALPWMSAGSARSPVGDAQRLHVARRAFEAQFVRAALVRAGGHRGRAASALGLSRQGLTKLLSRLGVVDTSTEPAASAHGAPGG